MGLFKRVAQAASWRYAVGEILIVVVGILLALGANNWHEARQDRRREQIYLESLITDLRSDTAQLGEKISYAEDRVLRGRALLDVLNGSAELTTMELAQAIEVAPSQSDPTIASYTLDDLKSTGSLRLIRDRELLREVFAYHSQVESTQQYQELYRQNTWYGFGRFRDRLLPPDLRLSMYGNTPDSAAANALDREALLRELRAIPQIEELLRAMVEANLEEIDAWVILQTQARELLEELTAPRRSLTPPAAP